MRHLRDVRSRASFRRMSIFAAVAALVAQTLLMPASAAFAAPVINEVMPKPVEVTGADKEWIEIKNLGSEAVDLSGMVLTTGIVPLGHAFDDKSILPNGIFVVCKVADAAPVCDDIWTGMSLDDSGDTVMLLESNGVTPVDQFAYESSDVIEGTSIEVVTEDGETTAVHNTQDEYTGGNAGTPGQENRALPAVENQTTGEGFSTLNGALADEDTAAGNTIILNENLTITSQVTITKAVTLDGQGFNVTANFVKSSNSNNSVIGVQASGVTIQNLTVNAVSGADQMLHGINVYEADDVDILNVTAINGRSGVVVGQGSTVTINGITTAGNIWHGVNVDKLGATLTIFGNNSHSEDVHLYIDNVNVGTINDDDEQYSIFQDGAARIYLLTSTLENEDGSVTLPAEDGVATTPDQDLIFESEDSVVVIPANTIITANSDAWDGTILPPTVSSYVVPGSFVTSLALTVGSNDYTLTFDQPVVLALVGQAGKSVGFVPAGSDVFTEITEICDDELLPEGANECKFDFDGSLFVVTNHFTTFVAYEQQPTNGNGGTGTGTGNQGVEPLEEIGDNETLAVRTVSYNNPQTTYNVTGDSQDGDVLGSSDNVGAIAESGPAPVVEPSEEGWKLWGMAWYWWVVIIGALGAAGWAGMNWYRNRGQA